RLFEEFWPVLRETDEALESWSKSHSEGARIPRTLGTHQFRIGDIEEDRALISFQQWKLQRVVDTYRSFQAEEKRSVDSFLQTVNGLEALQIDLKQRVRIENNRLVLA
ncbi:MAG: glutathione S-transferase, partial [Pseudomonadota bacterium]